MNEAVINEVPILGIPLFADQSRNIANAVYWGMGLSLDYRTLDKKSFLAAAKEIIDSNDKYVINGIFSNYFNKIYRVHILFLKKKKIPINNFINSIIIVNIVFC